MKYTRLGHTNEKVSKICLGTMTWGEQNNESEGHEQLDYAISKGINFIDTAELYSVPGNQKTYGSTERIIGTWLKKRKNRDKLIIASKIIGPSDYFSYVRNGPNYSIKQINEAIHGSLKRLQTDYIDLYQLHWPERSTNFFGQLGYVHKSDYTGHNFEEILMALQGYVKEGKIRYIGLSNETPWGVMTFLQKAKELNLPKIISIQNPYNLLNRAYEIGLAEISIREKTGLLAYSPTAGGLLSGKYLDRKKPENSRFTLFGHIFPRYDNDETENAITEYIALARMYGLSPIQMSLAFVNTRDFLTSTIIGATSMEQLKENIDSINISLSEDVKQGIENIHKKFPNPSP